MLELGGGLGYVASVAARRLGNDAVLTVEADPEMAAVIRGVFAANGCSPAVMFGAVSADGKHRALERAEDLWSTKASARDGGHEFSSRRA